MQDETIIARVIHVIRHTRWISCNLVMIMYANIIKRQIMTLRSDVNGGMRMDTTYRQWLILRMIPRKRRISTIEICKRLSVEHELDEHLRVIQRDLVSLERNFPLENDGKRPAGWRWQEDAPAFDIPNMDPVTALTFKLAEKYVGRMLPHGVLSALKPYALAADQRLKQTPTSRLYTWSEKVRVVSRNLAHIPPSVPDVISETVYAALLEERRFAARYRNQVRGGQRF